MSPSDSELTFTFPDADLCRDGEICARELTVIPLSAPISMRPPPSHTPSQAQIEDRDNTGTELQQPVEADKSVQVGPAANLDPPTDVGSVVERFPAGIRNGKPGNGPPGSPPPACQPVEADKSVLAVPAANLDPPTAVKSFVQGLPAAVVNGKPGTGSTEAEDVDSDTDSDDATPQAPTTASRGTRAGG